MAAGSGIGSASDQIFYNYRIRSGDFELHVASLSLADAWSRAGLMARETLASNSVFAAAFSTPTLSGSFFEYRPATGGPVSRNGSFPANYPNTWLRLKRVGNLFTGYGSYDGVTWMPLGSTTLAVPSSIYLGIAVGSQSGAQTTTAQIRDFGPVIGGNVVANMPSPYEPLGPSSRLTGLVISEIMSKPAKPGDNRVVDFIEIYNSNPFFQDMSGYKLSGDVDFVFPQGTIIPGGSFKVVAAVPADVQAVYGLSGVMGPYTDSLKRSGTVRLRDEQNAILLEINYSSDNPWPVAADGTGHSLVLARPSYGEGDPRAWDISDVIGGTPGAPETYRPSGLRNVVINEIFAYSADASLPDYVEFYNHSNETNDLSGCILTDDASTNKFIIPAGTIILPRGFVFFTGAQLGFGLSSGGETLYFKNPSGTRVVMSSNSRRKRMVFPLVGGPTVVGTFTQWPRALLALRTAPFEFMTLLLMSSCTILFPGMTTTSSLSFIIRERIRQISPAGDSHQGSISPFLPIALSQPRVTSSWRRTKRTCWRNTQTSRPITQWGTSAENLLIQGSVSRWLWPRPSLVPNAQGFTTNVVFPVVDEVTYGSGGRWGRWSHAGGSSLELIDPRGNHRLAANWGDSDESAKSAWTNIETTGVLDNGANFDPSIDYAQIGLLQEGECLVDNIEVRPNTTGANYVSNSDFESGTNGWNFAGSHVRSSLETNSGYASAVALHLRASDSMWTGLNAAQVTLTNTSLAAGGTATLRFKARWLRGWPEPLLRLHGNWLEATARMPVPNNLGTPAAPNSIAVSNAGPALVDVVHNPAVPAADQPVVVTALVHDPSGLQGVTLNYRVDPATTFVAVPMLDDGTGGDAIAGDGIYSARIPGNPANALAAFYVSATDFLGAASRFPALLNDNAPVRECGSCSGIARRRAASAPTTFGSRKAM